MSHFKPTAVDAGGRKHVLSTLVVSLVYVTCLIVARSNISNKNDFIPSDVMWVYQHPYTLIFSVPNFISMVHLVASRCTTLEALHKNTNDRLLQVAKESANANDLHEEIIACNAAVREASQSNICKCRWA